MVVATSTHRGWAGEMSEENTGACTTRIWQGWLLKAVADSFPRHGYVPGGEEERPLWVVLLSLSSPPPGPKDPLAKISDPDTKPMEINGKTLINVDGGPKGELQPPLFALYSGISLSQQYI